jgi:signal transduction histidine kinase
LTYFIVGFSLKPLKQLENQVAEIEAKNINQKISIKSSAREFDLLEHAFNSMLKRLDEAFSMQKQFSANAAHELRTPLAAMRTNIEVFHKQQNPEKTDYEETLHKMELQLERFSGVVDTLLQMTETQTASKTDRISLADLSEEVICDLTNLADAHQVQLNQLPGDAEVIGNDTLIYRAIYNLVENAIKYNKKGGMVTIEIKKENELAKVLITDTGIGIEPSKQAKVFEPFYRVDESRSRAVGGAGLGLSLVREIAKRHEGNVRVIQSTDEGTQIELTLKSE